MNNYSKLPEDTRIHIGSIRDRYLMYKQMDYFKEDPIFRPHVENVVRDVIMYHIIQNEGERVDDGLANYIREKVTNDLNEIFQLRGWAPDAISTIERLMRSKYHTGTKDSYREMTHHALLMKDAREVLIEQISNVISKYVPRPLGNVKFNVIMKDEIMNNEKESSIDAADKPFDFTVKSVSGKLYNHVYSIVDDLIKKSCDHVADMIIKDETFRIFPKIGYDEYKIAMLSSTIGHVLHLTFDINGVLAWSEASEAIVNKFKFKHYLDPKSNEAFIKHITDFVCRNLSFDKSMELEKKALQRDQEIEKVKSDIKDIVDNINETHNQPTENNKGEMIMKGNPQNIEVGDVVNFEVSGDTVTSVVLSIWEQGYLGIEEPHTVDGYKVRATVQSRGSFVNMTVSDLTIVRKWDGSIPEQKQEESRKQDIYRFIAGSDKTKETIKLATRIIPNTPMFHIVEIDRDDNIIAVTQDFAEGIAKFVCNNSDYNFVFDPKKCKYVGGTTELSFQTFVDEVLDPILVTALKQKAMEM